MNKQLEYLKSITDNLAYVDADLIKCAIQDMKDKPISIAKVSKGHWIDRVSIHDKDFRAKNIQRLSYIKDKDILLKMKNEGRYGRANFPGQSMFYGALTSREIKHNRATAFMETTSMIVDESKTEEHLTVSRWRIKEDFFVYECVFQNTCNVNTNTKESREKQKSYLNEIKLKNRIKKNAIEQLNFFSNEFSKYVDRNHSYDYKITAEFTDHILNHPKNKHNKLVGITYPSVQSILLRQNIVITPDAVDSLLEFEKAVIMKAEKTGGKNIKIEKSFAEANDCDEKGNLTWKEI